MNQCDKAGYCACDAGTCRISELEAEVEQEIEKRDFAQDCLQNAHIALGGDGEWKGKLPPEPPPDSGDLHYDVPALAEEVMECLNAAEAEVERLKAGGCARDQRTTQFCAEAVRLQAKLEAVEGLPKHKARLVGTAEYLPSPVELDVEVNSDQVIGVVLAADIQAILRESEDT